MEHTNYWTEQIVNQPLFEDIIWNKPDNKLHSGQVALIGGHANMFNSMSSAYNGVIQAGIGSATLVIPDSLRKIIGSYDLPVVYAPSNPSGSFGLSAFQILVDQARLNEAAFLVGDMSKNSETAILLEKFINQNSTLTFLSNDVLNSLLILPATSLNNENIIIEVSGPTLQKMLINIRFPMAYLSKMPLNKFAELLHSITLEYNFSLVASHFDQTFVAKKGIVYSQKTSLSGNNIFEKIVVWIIQQPSKTLESAISSLA